MIGWMASSKAGHDKDKIYIIIEETDHFYAPISLFYSQRIGNEQQIKDIENHLNSHCCICGSDEDVNTSKSREYEDYSMPLKFCGSCLAKQESPFHGLIYEIKKQTQFPSYTASHTKVRLKTEDGNFIYRFAEDIKFKDGHFVVRNDISLYYWKSKSDAEIDFILYNKKDLKKYFR